MPTVCVIGGGTAGAEAAWEAVRDRAKVSVMDNSHHPEPPWRSWPSLIGGPHPTVDIPNRHRLPPEATALSIGADSVRGGSVLCSDGKTANFDRVVVATGSGFAPVVLPGHRKPGFHVMTSAGRYSELGRRRDSVNKAVIAGEGLRALEVSDKLCGKGRSVQSVVSHWRHGQPSQAVLEVIMGAAEEMGVSIMWGRVARAVGTGVVEALVVGGVVLPCDAAVFLPDRIPRPVRTDANLGAFGGLSVDWNLRTSSPSTFAAGGCGELQRFNSSRVLDEEPRMTGRVAGANALGHSIQISTAVRWEAEIFGLRWSGFEVDPRHGSDRCRPPSKISQKWGPSSACTLTFETQTGRVSRVELIEPIRGQTREAPFLPSDGFSLCSLAYASSSDISLVSDTARLGLGRWSNS